MATDQRPRREVITGPRRDVRRRPHRSAVDDLDQAIEIANASQFGLNAAVFTNDVTQAIRAGRRIKAGIVSVNGGNTYRPDVAAFGGVHGRDLTGEVVVPGPGGDAVEGHRHTLPKPIEEAIGTRQLRGIFGNAEGVCHMRKVVP